MIAIGRAHAIAAGGSSPDAMVAHLALDPPAADGLSPGTERCMNSGRAVSCIVPGGDHEPAGCRPEARDWPSCAGSPVS
jgi:hypothetical protein